MEERDRVARLTPRQRECLYLVHEGYSMKGIAAALGISPETVKEHLEKAKAVLGTGGKSMQAARLLVQATGLPPNVGGIDLGGSSGPLPAASSADRRGERHGADLDLREPITPFIIEHPHSTSRWQWPWQTTERPNNNLSALQRILYGLGIAFVLAAILGAILQLQRTLS